MNKFQLELLQESQQEFLVVMPEEFLSHSLQNMYGGISRGIPGGIIGKLSEYLKVFLVKSLEELLQEFLEKIP